MNIGDHIRALKGGRWLHGIDCGDRTVVYFSTRADNGIPGVRRARLSEFAGGADQLQIVTHAERVFPPRMVVARAFSRLRESAFSQMFSDSEQFAAWCKIGRLGPAAASDVVVAPAAVKAQAAKRKAVKAKPARAKARTALRARPPAARPRKAKQKAPGQRAAKARSKAKPRVKAAGTKRATPRKARSKVARAKPGAKKHRR